MKTLSDLPPGVSIFDEHINPAPEPELKRVKRIRSHTGYSRFLAECKDYNFSRSIPRQDNIPSPYHYSPEWTVYGHEKYGHVVIVETAHRCYDVFQVRRDLILYS